MIRTSVWSWSVTLMVAMAVVTPQVAFAQSTRRVQVNIDSVPQGATVRLDNEQSNPIGTTPLRLFRVVAGAHTLYFQRDGYLPGQLNITVARRAETFTATMTQAGSIYVSADVDGAQVFMDGNPVGTTPGRINNVTPGQHVIELRQTGMEPHRETVTVGAGAVASVNASLRPPPPQAPPTGTVRVIVSNPNGPLPSDLAVTFDGTPMTGTPPSVDAAQPGQHIVQVSANGFRTVRREVAVTAGQSIALAVDLDAVQVAPTGGSVRVLTTPPNAAVTLDGEQLQGTPPARDNVPAGTHVLRVAAQGFTPVSREITVTAGQASNLQVDLEAVANVNHLSVRTPTPNATVFIDGRNVGPSPYQRDDMPAGDYNITLRAPGFDDRNERCSVSLQQACDVNVPLNRSVGHGSIHVELGHPVATRAVVLLDGAEIGEVGAGRDIPNITATNHEIRVHADRYEDYVEAITLQDGEQHRTIVNMRRAHNGPTGAELAARRSAMSTWGASPLARGDAAVDVFAQYGAYPAEIRGTIGLVSYGPGGADVGFGVRTLGLMTELELRGRVGLRLLDGLVNIGAEAAAFAGIGVSSQNSVGFRAFALASIHTLAPTSDEAADTDDPSQQSDHFGSFALTLRFGFEAMHDTLNGTLYHAGNDPAGHNRFDACDPVPTATGTMPTTPAGPCGVSTTRDAMGNIFVHDGGQGLVRPIVGAVIEFGLSRHANVFIGLDRVLLNMDARDGDVLTNGRSNQRAIYQNLWGGSDNGTYIRLGLTYKF